MNLTTNTGEKTGPPKKRYLHFSLFPYSSVAKIPAKRKKKKNKQKKSLYFNH